LDSKRNTSDRIICFRGNKINSLSEEEGKRQLRIKSRRRFSEQLLYFAKLIGKVESLKERVHVARGALVLQADISRVLFGIPTGMISLHRQHYTI
jgi:hypothetical protein